MIDGGATRTMASVYAMEQYMKAMKEQHGTDGVKHTGVKEEDRPILALEIHKRPSVFPPVY